MSAINPVIKEAMMIGSLRGEALALPESGLVNVASYGRQRDDVIALWAGEGDCATPDFICRAAADAFASGQTFYTYQRGIPELRAALADYCQQLYQRPFEAEEFFVTCGGMQAIDVALRMILGPGDQVVIPTPAWPNFAAGAEMIGAAPRYVPMTFAEAGWRLDLEGLFEACKSDVKALVINTPANPTGWTASPTELKAILDLARSRGLWIIADEIYGRFCYGHDLAPSFHDFREPDDRLLFVNSFSKNWAMTGWRLGWLQAPAALGQIVENLIQYKTMGVPTALQWAGLAALRDGEQFVASQITRAAEGRDIVCSALETNDRVRFAKPDGAFYLMFSIDGVDATTEAALQIIDEASVGLAPGSAFGADGEGYFRLCFANSPERLTKAMDRLLSWLAGQ